MTGSKEIKLYDFITSPNCQRVKIVLHEKKLPYEIVPINIRKYEQKSPAFLKINPLGKVPVLVDGETAIYESCIINEYLNERYPDPPLMPDDSAGRAKGRLLIAYGLDHIEAAYQALRHELLKKEEVRDSEVIDGNTHKLRQYLEYLEQEIGEKSYFLGEFSLVDTALVTRFLRMQIMGVLPWPSLPRLENWLERMKERPSVRAIM